MTNDVFERVYGLLSDEDVLVEFANSQGEVVPKGDIRVGLKAAALIGAFGRAYEMCIEENAEADGQAFLENLVCIASTGDDSESLTSSSRFTAHLTWLTSQLFRGPDYIKRISEFTFTNLDGDALHKDTQHIRHAARFLYHKLRREKSAAA